MWAGLQCRLYPRVTRLTQCYRSARNRTGGCCCPDPRVMSWDPLAGTADLANPHSCVTITNILIIQSVFCISQHHLRPISTLSSATSLTFWRTRRTYTTSSLLTEFLMKNWINGFELVRLHCDLHHQNHQLKSVKVPTSSPPFSAFILFLFKS